MNARLLATLSLIVWLFGCNCQQSPATSSTPATPVAEKKATAPEKAADHPPVAGDAVKPGSPQRFSAYRWPADYKPPLEFHFDLPEVPEEISRPSPPIPKALKTPEKTAP